MKRMKRIKRIKMNKINNFLRKQNNRKEPEDNKLKNIYAHLRIFTVTNLIHSNKKEQKRKKKEVKKD